MSFPSEIWKLNQNFFQVNEDCFWVEFFTEFFCYYRFGDVNLFTFGLIGLYDSRVCRLFLKSVSKAWIVSSSSISPVSMRKACHHTDLFFPSPSRSLDCAGFDLLCLKWLIHLFSLLRSPLLCKVGHCSISYVVSQGCLVRQEIVLADRGIGSCLWILRPGVGFLPLWYRRARI